MVRGPTLEGTAKNAPDPVIGVEIPFLIIVTEYDCRCPRPGLENDVICGGTISVPGGTGAGELAGAVIPIPAPANTWNRFGSRCSVVKRNWKVMSSTASWLLSILIS